MSDKKEHVDRKAERKKYAPNARWFDRPVCWFYGHDRPTDDDGWSRIHCQRCGKAFPDYKLRDYISRYRSKVAFIVLDLANLIHGSDVPTDGPLFRAVNMKRIKELGTEHSCDAYSYEHLKSLVEQDGPDGFGATATIKWLISEDGWVNITEDNAKEMTEEVNKSLEYESNRQEREKTMIAAGLAPDPNQPES